MFSHVILKFLCSIVLNYSGQLPHHDFKFSVCVKSGYLARQLWKELFWWLTVSVLKAVLCNEMVLLRHCGPLKLAVTISTTKHAFLSSPWLLQGVLLHNFCSHSYGYSVTFFLTGCNSLPTFLKPSIPSEVYLSLYSNMILTLWSRIYNGPLSPSIANPSVDFEDAAACFSPASSLSPSALTLCFDHVCVCPSLPLDKSSWSDLSSHPESSCLFPKESYIRTAPPGLEFHCPPAPGWWAFSSEELCAGCWGLLGLCSLCVLQAGYCSRSLNGW